MSTSQEKSYFDLDDRGEKIDQAIDREEFDALNEFDAQCLQELENATGSTETRLWYFRANIQSAFRRDTNEWAWRQPNREREILYLRRARDSEGFALLDKLVQCQITTNLANSLHFLGRGVEAIALYGTALKKLPGFAMARGNRANAYESHAKLLYDRYHSAHLLRAAFDDYDIATGASAIWDGDYPGLRSQFKMRAKRLTDIVDIEGVRSIDLGDYSLGRSKREREFRSWALNFGFFLNPLNILGSYPIGADDDFGLPSYRAPAGEPPRFVAWFNQLKQEYAAARLLLFEAVTDKARHFVDRELFLIDTLDYSAFGIALEKLRLAFRTAYGLLDKVAGFINAYFVLGAKEDQVNLRNIWLAKDGQSVRSEFVDYPNLPLRGLYWLAFDIVGKNVEHPDAIAPDARELQKLRNALEHRCLILREPGLGDIPNGLENCSVDVFENHAFTILRLAQAALIYLSLAVGREEHRRQNECGQISIPMHLPTYRGRVR